MLIMALAMAAGQVHAAKAEAVETPSAEAMVDALNSTFGRHAKKRASHAKGMCAIGHFTADAKASAFSSTPMFRTGRYPATLRFSIGGGNPGVSDKAPAVRGMGITIAGPDDQMLTLAMISTPTFFAASRESFVSFLAARRPDPATGKPDPARVAESNRTHLDSEAQRRWLAAVPPSASYGTERYFATHTYFFATGDAKAAARWIFEPVAGRIGLTPDEMKSMPDHYLEAELARRIATGPIEWRVMLQLPEPTDPLLNPTVAWPDSRRTVEVGRLVVDKVIAAGSDEDCDAMVFDPTILPAGITPSDDPMFALRSEAYAISSARRAE